LGLAIIDQIIPETESKKPDYWKYDTILQNLEKAGIIKTLGDLTVNHPVS